MSDRIDHAAEARNCISYARTTESSAEAHLSQAEAQVHATLALVEQQRIANLIALAQPVQLPGGGEARYDIYEVEYGNVGDVMSCALRPEVREALGL
ncbi:hypothetical protein [Leucobacter luti]|uniref:Uncharacterized protein n=1 Tax=Leucobacter luti TaxID=340320 RepID=A0A4Q7U0L4_9MICO|nr:hypothetical protein [Leucobacter luti]MBL3699266.1 hypothetical protein [Leucobacter luti]RZT66773.1 hypothetical protein EV139_0900 [Leucobacter luti]